MRKLLKEWRFYGLGEVEYREAMDKIFAKNILSLLRANIVVIIILAGFIIVPLFIDKNITKTIFFFSTGVFATLIYIIVKCKYHPHEKKNKLRKSHIYTLIFLSYANVVSLGIYLGVWANPGKVDGSFLAILICALLLFNILPIYHLCLTVISMITFIVIVIMVKTPAEHAIDMPNALFAGIIGIFFGWQIIMNRLSLALIANRMERERNSYYKQSTIIV